MRIALLLGLLIFLALSLPEAVIAQGFADFQKNAKKTIESYDPELKVTKITTEGRLIVYQYGPKERAVMVQIFYGETRKDAMDFMKKSFKFLSVGPGERISGIGDEAWATGIADRSGGVRFRKGNVYFDVAAPSLEKAKVLATELAKLVRSR